MTEVEHVVWWKEELEERRRAGRRREGSDRRKARGKGWHGSGEVGVERREGEKRWGRRGEAGGGEGGKRRGGGEKKVEGWVRFEGRCGERGCPRGGVPQERTQGESEKAGDRIDLGVSLW